MTALPPGRRNGAAASPLLYPAAAMALGAAACVDASGVHDLLRMLIGLGGPLATLGLVFQRNATMVGILLALFLWPLGLLYALTKRGRREGEDRGIARRKPDGPAAADRKLPATIRATT